MIGYVMELITHGTPSIDTCTWPPFNTCRNQHLCTWKGRSEGEGKMIRYLFGISVNAPAFAQKVPLPRYQGTEKVCLLSAPSPPSSADSTHSLSLHQL